MTLEPEVDRSAGEVGGCGGTASCVLLVRCWQQHGQAQGLSTVRWQSFEAQGPSSCAPTTRTWHEQDRQAPKVLAQVSQRALVHGGEPAALLRVVPAEGAGARRRASGA